MSLSIQVPTVGQANSTEAVKVTNSLTNLSSWANGNIPGSDLSASANIAFTQLAAGAGRMNAVGASANITAASGQLIYASNGTSYQVTLPPPSVNALVGVSVFGAGSGTITIAVNGGVIFGAGLAIAGATSLKLAAAGAFVVLHSEGSNWFVISGQQDTGWVALTLVNSWTTLAGYSTPACRLSGDKVFLRGGLNGLSASSTTIATLPAGSRPPATVGWIGGVGTEPVSLTSAGVLSCAPVPINVSIDGMNFGV